MATTVSSLMKRIGSLASPLLGKRMKRSSCGGIGMSACMALSEPSRTSSSPRVKPKFAMNGNGWAGSTAIGVSTGKIWSRKCASSHSPLMIGKLVGAQHVDAGFGKQRLERDPVFLLLRGQLGDRAVDAVELLGRREAVLARRLDAGDDLAAQTRHAHHVELVEIRGGDRQEAQALEQRMALVLGLLQHPSD